MYSPPLAVDSCVLHDGPRVVHSPRLARAVALLVGFAFLLMSRPGQVGAEEADLHLPVNLLDGQKRTLKDYQGKVVVLAFWTVDCTNCKAEMPHLDRLYKKYRNQGLEVIAVNLDPPRNASRVKPTVRRYRYTFAVALDPEGELAAPFDPTRATPCTVVLDRTGKTAYNHLGYRPGDEQALEKVVVDLLGRSGTPAAKPAEAVSAGAGGEVAEP